MSERQKTRPPQDEPGPSGRSGGCGCDVLYESLHPVGADDAKLLTHHGDRSGALGSDGEGDGDAAIAVLDEHDFQTFYLIDRRHFVLVLLAERDLYRRLI